MSHVAEPDVAQFDAWHPGIESQVPDRLLHLSTLFRPDASFTTAEKGRELRDFTWLGYRELVGLRPERLALHELLIRVTADVSVPDGERVEDLGINFRKIVRALLARCIAPRMADIAALYDAIRRDIVKIAESELALLAPHAPAHDAQPPPRRSLFEIFSRRRAVAEPPPALSEDGIVARWQDEAHTSDDPLRRSTCRALAKIVGAVNVRHGSARVAHGIVAPLVVDIACNEAAADAIGRLIAPWVREGAVAEGCRLLPAQEHPVVLNTKGASAAGKSTIRPLQRALAREIGVDWGEFALISPDVWRKQLLDYASLGPDYKYGAALTADELHIVDQKLDQYMAAKAERGEMTHLLIDRFRFDSFAPDSQEAGSNLLTRFGQIVYLYFMITPPESLVERAWNRGLELGRYKAVDDTLAHAVEAYSGIPGLFFTWIERPDKRVRFEFLDNSVNLGERPRTIAFGTNDALCVLDVGAMLDIERYRRINVDANSPSTLYAEHGLLLPEHNTRFIAESVRRFSTTYFADQASGRVYLELASGKPVSCDRSGLARAMENPDARAGLLAVAPQAASGTIARFDHPPLLQELDADARRRTLGQWGGRR